MKSLYKNEQSGRSMVEMLGVLAIIGVLSIGGISGYSKAMSKYRVNKTLDQISMLVINIRTLFSSSVNYEGLDPTLAVKMGIVPRDMQAGTASSRVIRNSYQGQVFLGVGGTKDAADNTKFYVEYTGLPQEACVSIATADWGSQAGSGLQSIQVGETKNKTTDTIEGTNVFEIDNLPISLKDATNACSGTTDNGNGIKWFYY